MKIVDSGITAVLVDVDKRWHMRIVAPTMNAEAEMRGHPYLWYRWIESGWRSVGERDEGLEQDYQELLKETK